MIERKLDKSTLGKIKTDLGSDYSVILEFMKTKSCKTCPLMLIENSKTFRNWLLKSERKLKENSSKVKALTPLEQTQIYVFLKRKA